MPPLKTRRLPQNRMLIHVIASYHKYYPFSFPPPPPPHTHTHYLGADLQMWCQPSQRGDIDTLIVECWLRGRGLRGTCGTSTALHRLVWEEEEEEEEEEEGEGGGGGGGGRGICSYICHRTLPHSRQWYTHCEKRQREQVPLGEESWLRDFALSTSSRSLLGLMSCKGR